VAKGLWVVVAAVLAAACAPPVDLTEGLEVLEVSTGWADAGIVGGQNKIVPSVSFRLKNRSDQPLKVLQVNATFRQIEGQEFGSQFIRVSGPEGLAPGATTEILTAVSDKGYTGEDPRADMLSNKRFVDAKVELSAKHGAELLTRVAEFPIERRLLAQ
jgi:hypothetical protein